MNIFYKIKLYLQLLRYRGLKERSQYSRWGEDSFLVDYFKNTSNGRYIDIGSFHPFRGSNTYLLYKKGWSGINIDINKISIDFTVPYLLSRQLHSTLFLHRLVLRAR